MARLMYNVKDVQEILGVGESKRITLTFYQTIGPEIGALYQLR